MSSPNSQLEKLPLPAQRSKPETTGLLTKSALLADLLSKPDVYDRIDSGWRLVMWLMMVKSGVVIESYDVIAEQLGSISKSTVKRWADELVEGGIMERKQKGARVELKLIGDYMKVANAPDVTHATAPVSYTETADMTALQKIAEGTEELGGQMVITIQGCQLSKKK